MKNLGGQDIRSEKQEKGSRWKGSIHESAPSPLGHPTPNRSPGVPAYSLEVVSAKKKKKCILPCFCCFPQQSPTELLREEYHLTYCIV